MEIRLEDFFQSLLSKQSDELLFSEWALVARMKDELLAGPEVAHRGHHRRACGYQREQAAQELSRRYEL
jgi:hypothetical protein